MKHTPGPWKVFDAYEVYDDDGRPESINCLYVGTDSGERVIRPADYGHEINMTEANARLVITAPDLLAACEYGHDEHALDRLALKLEGVDGFSGFVPWLKRKAELERAAIAKAKGGTE